MGNLPSSAVLAVVLAVSPWRAAAAEGEPYLVPAGRSPIPQPGEVIVEPIDPDDVGDVRVVEVPDGPVLWSDAGRYVGQFITAEGLVVDAGNIGHIAFLNFAKDRGAAGGFYIAMFEEAFDDLPAPPEQHYLNRAIRVTGPVSVHRGRPQIQVRDVAQIELIDAVTAKPMAVAEAEEAAASGDAVPWTEAGARVGEVLTVEGKVVETRDIGSLTFLNFGRGQDSFYAVVFRDAYGDFPAPPADYLRGKTVRISGEVTTHKGRPQIQVRSGGQVRVVE